MDFHQSLYTDAVKSWFEIANRQISSIFLPELSACHIKAVGYYHFTFFM